MTSSSGRSNGLHAATYVALVDLDPQLADAVLELLRDEEIAAYATPAVARPAAGIVVPRTDRPLDRVYVDASAAPRARVVLHGRLPALRADHEPAPPADEDAIWAGLVASYDAPTADPVPRWPASEDIEEGPREPSARVVESGPEPGRQPPPQPRPARDAEEHYVPPPPPPLPRTDAVTKVAWLGLLGGPVLLVVGLLVGLDLSGWLGILAVGGFVAGFVVLIARMKDRPPTDWGPDDGAVV